MAGGVAVSARPEEPGALAARVGAAARQRRLMLTTAESCTGGWLAQAITSVAGSSEWFDRGYVTYSNRSKEEALGVAAETLRVHGAVSENTAREMAEGALARSATGMAVAITGVAGPSGGTPEKPVGMVCFAWARAGGGTDTETHRFAGDRESVRRQSVIVALKGLLQRLDSGD